MNSAALTQVRENLKAIVDDVVATGDEYLITRHGKPLAVILGFEEYEALVESLNLLSDDDALDAIAEGESDVARGQILDIAEL